MGKPSLEHKEPYPEDSTTMKYTNDKKGFGSKVCSIITNITVEPMIICYVVAYIVTGLTSQNLHLDKACNVNLQMNKSICDAIKYRNLSGYNISQEVQIQKIVAKAYTWKFVIHSTFSAIILAFVGSWSDRNGRRKAIVLAPLFSEMCTVLGLILCTYFFYELPLEFNIISETISIALTGGINTFMVGIFTIICARTTIEQRTVRVGIGHVLFQLGLTVALGAGGYLFSRLGFYGVYSMALAMHLLSALYGWFIIEDAEKPQTTSTKKIGFFRDFFDFKSLKSTIEILFKNPNKLKRKKIFLTLVIAMMTMGPVQGEIGVLYLYTRYKFQWNEVDFSLFFAFASIAHVVGSTIGLLVFSKLLKMDDALMGCIAAVSKIAGSLAFAFAPTGTAFYMAILADVLTSVVGIAMRAVVTKQATSDEQGKMNAIFGLAEAFVPVAYGPLYSTTYRTTIEVFPGTFYILSSVLTIPVFGIFLWLYKNRIPEIQEKPADLEKMEKLLVK